MRARRHRLAGILINIGGMMPRFVFYKSGTNCRLKWLMSIMLMLSCIALPVYADPSNTLTLKNDSDVVATQYPVQIARLFVQGEIPNFPRAIIDGVSVLTQADIKQRWPDNSVKHAILSFVVPELKPNVSYRVSFRDQESGNNGPTDVLTLLDTGFDAEVILTQGETSKRSSVRDMLTNGHFSLWTQGSVVTTFVVADHSAERVHDLGFDDLRSIRPIYHVSYWSSTGDIKVRYIAENINTETLKNISYSSQLTLNGETQYQQPQEQTHYYGSRWTKVFWNNTPEQKVSINHNLAYLKETRFFSNYDVSLEIPEQQLTNTYQGFLEADIDLYGDGLWQSRMGTTGGRVDLGIHPSWVTAWLYTGDWRMQEISARQADLAANWSTHSREGDSSKSYLREGETDALGKPISVNARPSLWLYDHRNLNITSSEDVVELHNAPNEGWGYWGRGDSWSDDIAHRVNPYSALYALTGEYWYLEQLQLWAATSAMEHTSNALRGPNNMAGIHGQTRGEGRGFRERVHALLLTPDDTPEKQYFTDIVYDTIALWAGERNIPLPELQEHPAYIHGTNNLVPLTPNHFWQSNSAINSNATPHLFGEDFSDVKAGGAPWMYSVFRASVGEAAQMGLPTQALVDWSDEFLTSLFDSTVSRHAVSAYFIAIESTEDRYLTWPEIVERMPNFDALVARGENIAANRQAINVNHGYETLAYASSTYLRSGEKQDEVRRWLKDNYYSPQRSNFARNPQWAILPRIQDTPRPLSGLSPVFPSPGNTNASSRDETRERSSDNETVPDPPVHPEPLPASKDVPGAYVYMNFDKSIEDSQLNFYPESIGDVSYEEGRYGAAVYFDGSSYLNVSNYEIAPPYSFSVWIKPEQASRAWPGETFVIADGARSGACLSTPTIRYNSNYEVLTKTAAACGADLEATVERVAFDHWQHITVVVEENRTVVYVNGEEASTLEEIQNSSTTKANTCLFIGARQAGDCRSPNNFYRGLMDELRIYPRALSVDEVSRVYRVDPGLSESQVGIEGDITDSLIAHIDFESEPTDVLGHQISGIPPALVEGKYGFAGEFNGFDTYLNIEGINIAPQYSLSFWLKPNMTPRWPYEEVGIVDGGRSGACQFVPYVGYRVPTAFRWLGDTNASHLTARTGDCSTSTFRSSTLLEVGSWHHVAVVAFNGARQIYINGELVEDIETEVSAAENQCVFVGARQLGTCNNPTNFFNGAIDELRIYGRALSGEEVTTLVNLGDVSQQPQELILE